MDDRSALIGAVLSKKNVIDFETHTMDSQMESVNARLKRLKTDIIFYSAWIFGLLLVFFVLFVIFLFVYSGNSPMDIFIGGIGLSVVIGTMFIYLLTLPAFIYNLCKSLYLYHLNREEEELAFIEPKPVTNLYSRQTYRPDPESSYPVEKQKLAWILSRYYLYQSQLQQMLSDLKNPEVQISSLEIHQKLNNMVIYEAIGPAQPITKEATAKIRTRAIIFGGIIAMFLLIMLGMIWPS